MRVVSNQNCHPGKAMQLVSSPDHTLYVSSERWSGVIPRFLGPVEPLLQRENIDKYFHRWLELTTVLCTVNCKLRPMWENVSRQHRRWFSQDERKRVGLQSNFPEPVGRQTKTSSSQYQVADCFFVAISLLTITKPCKCLFHCLPSYWLK